MIFYEMLLLVANGGGEGNRILPPHRALSLIPALGVPNRVPLQICHLIFKVGKASFYL
jgi:hypothetical protein